MACRKLGNTTIGVKISPFGLKPLAFTLPGFTVKDWLFYHLNWLGLDICDGQRDGHRTERSLV